jgi:hypothetical protein
VTEAALELASVLLAEAAAGVALWPKSAPVELRAAELVPRPRCRKPTLDVDQPYHLSKRCPQRPKEQKVGSFVSRKDRL